MRYCWSYNDHSPPWISLCWFVIGSAFSGGILYLSYYRSLTPLICLILLPLTVISFLIAFITARRYQLNPNGVLVQYPFRIKHYIYWEQFAEISLCKIHYASASNSHILAIRCVIGTEKCSPRQATVARGRWSTPEYEVFHCRHILSVYYTTDRIAEFHRFCPHHLSDYRHLKDSL